MINEILLRSYTEEGYDKIQEIMSVIMSHTDMEVSVVDHSRVSYLDFDILDDEVIISIDKFISEQLNVPYFQISRVFNLNGKPLYRHVSGDIVSTGANVRIIDTDKVFGDSIKLACEIFNTPNYSTLLTLNKNQDLIDIEDLLYPQSLLMYNGKTTKCSYLLNEKFFTTRTSLPKSCYKQFCRILNYE
jgi:hypothetical protein